MFMNTRANSAYSLTQVVAIIEMRLTDSVIVLVLTVTIISLVLTVADDYNV